MLQSTIRPEEVQTLKLIDWVSDRFRADHGFELPGISAAQIRDDVAERFEAGRVDDDSLKALAGMGLVHVSRTTGNADFYALTPRGRVLAREEAETPPWLN